MDKLFVGDARIDTLALLGGISASCAKFSLCTAFARSINLRRLLNNLPFLVSIFSFVPTLNKVLPDLQS